MHPGLIRGEEVSSVQQQLNHRLEMLQHESHWHLPPSRRPTHSHCWPLWRAADARLLPDEPAPPEQAIKGASTAINVETHELEDQKQHMSASAAGVGLGVGQGSVGRSLMSEGFNRAAKPRRRSFDYMGSIRRRYSYPY